MCVCVCVCVRVCERLSKFVYHYGCFLFLSRAFNMNLLRLKHFWSSIRQSRPRYVIIYNLKMFRTIILVTIIFNRTSHFYTQYVTTCNEGG